MATIKKACKGTIYPKASSVSKKLKSGGDLGMKSVKAGVDKNPGVTRADIIVAGQGKAKKGKMVKKAAPKKAMMKKAPMQPSPSPMSAPMMKKGGAAKKTMKKGGKMSKKCGYGC